MYDTALSPLQIYALYKGAILSPNTPSGNKAIYTVPIELTNSQTSATGGDFQQMLTVNSLAYQNYITPGWTNVEFTTGPQATDIYRVVTLNELRAQAGCAGSTQGDLRIANNELPIACNGISYSVTLYGDGGVAPLSYAFSGLPVGLANAGAVISGTAIVNGAYPVVVTATDSQLPGARSVQRKYTLTVKSCP